ncbi:CRTAC1 family protein [Verrucomicrobiaceae bacterium 227]
MSPKLLFVLATLPPISWAAEWSFTDVTAEVIDFNPPGIGPIFDYAFVDLNDDHLLDIVLNNHHQSKPSPIWLGTPDHKFKFWGNMPREWLPIAGFHLGEVDHDGDGKTDLICTGNEGGVIINLNRTPPGTDKLTYHSVPIHSSSHLVSFADFNGDGSLETLIRPGQIFSEITTDPTSSGLQYGNWTIADFNNDGWPDLFGAGEENRRKNWRGPRKLFKNHQGTLEEIPLPSSLDAPHLGGIPKIADFNQDGNMDLYIFGSTDPSTGEIQPMKFFLGDGKFGFLDISETTGTSNARLKPGYSHVYLADLDNDSHPDLINQGNYGTAFWRNNGDTTFTLLPKSQTNHWTANAHMRFDDFDMDGRLDIVTSDHGPNWKNRPRSIRVFRNTTENDNHWMKVKLQQPGNNTMAIGAIVSIYDAEKGKLLGKQILSSDTEGSHPRLHFGLGTSTKIHLAITWPTSRETQRFSGVSANQYLLLRPNGMIKKLN